ncbi:MAG: phage/plasmid primase, P4 family [Candidatus Aenigmatarchaeota archaeon]
MTEIPVHLRDNRFRFVKIKAKEKAPFEVNWQSSNNYTFDSQELSEHLAKGGNYGIVCGVGGLVVVDVDREELGKLMEALPETFVVKTGNKDPNRKHFYFICPDCDRKIVVARNGTHYGEIQGIGSQIVGPGSIHPNKKPYTVLHDKPIATITWKELKDALKGLRSRYDKKIFVPVTMTSAVKTLPNNVKQLIENGCEEGFRNMNTWIVVKELYKLGYDPTIIEKMALDFNSRCKPPRDANEVAMHVKYLLRRPTSYLSEKLESDTIENLMEKKILETESSESVPLMELKSFITSIENKIEMAEQFYAKEPFSYDKAKIWWIWNHKRKCFEMVDETDLMICIDDALDIKERTTKSDIKNEILEAMRRVGRRRQPKPLGKTWVQFDKTIVDVSTGEIMDATPDFFATNPIPWELGESEDTPTIDKLFRDWVGEKYARTLYEIVAYCFLPNYPIHRIFCFIGYGMNGKTTFLNLLAKAVGKDNCASANLDLLLKSRFESARLYKKLICLMGETNFTILSKTDIIKRLTGQDLIGFEFKNRDPFQDFNYAKILLATNSLPMTTDRTKGFYRRWLCIDFPNQFSEKVDILSTIPDEEYRNLARKSMRILKELLSGREFTNEGTLDERERKYEELSNPITKFINEKYDKDPDGKVPFSDFRDSFLIYLKKNKFRSMSSKEIGSTVAREGFEKRRINVKLRDGTKTTKYFILGIKNKWSAENDVQSMLEK